MSSCSAQLCVCKGQMWHSFQRHQAATKETRVFHLKHITEVYMTASQLSRACTEQILAGLLAQTFQGHMQTNYMTMWHALLYYLSFQQDSWPLVAVTGSTRGRSLHLAAMMWQSWTCAVAGSVTIPRTTRPAALPGTWMTVPRHDHSTKVILVALPSVPGRECLREVQ